MDKSVSGITIYIRSQKKGVTTTKVKDIVRIFVVKLHGLNTGNKFLNTQLPLNENDNNFDGNLNDIS